MQQITIASLISFLLLVVAGCTSTPPGESKQAAVFEAAAVPEQEHGEVSDVVQVHIQRLRDKYDAIPDKTGILAEKRLYSVVAEELIIRDYFEDRREGFFLDVGCAWAVFGSNTYYLERHLDWTGIGIDALDDYAAEWAEVRPTSTFMNYLITNKTGGYGTFFKSDSLGLSSTSKGHAAGKLFGVKAEPKEIKVPMITLNDLLDGAGVTKIDLLSMDIEGHEAKAFAGFDIERFAPELLVIEGESNQVEMYLASHGYVEIERYKQYDEINRYFERK